VKDWSSRFDESRPDKWERVSLLLFFSVPLSITLEFLIPPAGIFVEAAVVVATFVCLVRLAIERPRPRYFVTKFAAFLAIATILSGWIGIKFLLAGI